MAALKMFFPHTGSDEEWNAAYYRLEDYLRAMHIVNKVQQSQIILRILKSAAMRHELNPKLNPTTLAVDELWAAMDTWFNRIEPDKDSFSAAGRLAFLLTDAPEKWPHVFLSEQISRDFADALRARDVQSGPDLQISSMVPRPLDLPAPEIPAPPQWETGNLIFPLLSTVAVLTLIIIFFLQ